jgi:nucleotide-binding universal stress UspA family protein/predicted phosphoribosyltransferase
MRREALMQPPRRILVPYDFTGPSKRACDYALEFAASVGAALTLVHVVERFDMTLTSAEHANLVTATKHELDRAAMLLRPHVRDLEVVVTEGTPWQEIDRVALERGVDMIIMGTHGRRGIARALLGSVAARVVRTASVPVVTVPEYVAIARNVAGERLALPLERLRFEQPAVLALSRGALTIATALAERAHGTVDLWAVEPIVARDGTVLGAMGEDEAIVLEPGRVADDAVADEAVASARTRLRAELSAIKGTRSVGDCWKRNVVLVADGLFSVSYARVALEGVRTLGASKVAIASPVVSREVALRLEGELEGIFALDRATVADACTYREDVLPSDVVAYELLLSPTVAGGES